MDWTPIAPYLVATLAFLRWPTLWIVIVVVSAFSVYRGRAALTSGVATIIGLAFLLDAEIAGPHLELANYGHVIFAAAVTATLLMLPTILWTPLDAGPKAIGPPGTVRSGLLRLLRVPLLLGAVIAVDIGFEYLDPEPTDARTTLYWLFILLPAILAARWLAGGTWMVSGPLLSRWPRLRRSLAAGTVAALMIAAYDDRAIPYALATAGDFADDTFAASDTDIDDCATVTAHLDYNTLRLAGTICPDTPAAFETTHAAHPQIRRFVLDSRGGNSYAGLTLGRRLQALEFDARVDGQCSSAWFTILMGAVRRQVGPEGYVAVHQTSANVWAERGQRARWPLSTSEEVTSFQQERGAPYDLILRAADTPPDDLDVLSNQDLINYGIAQPTTDAAWLPLPPWPHRATHRHRRARSAVLAIHRRTRKPILRHTREPFTRRTRETILRRTREGGCPAPCCPHSTLTPSPASAPTH